MAFRRLEIEPQVFLLRWIRLLFCREFDLQESIVDLQESIVTPFPPPPPRNRGPYEGLIKGKWWVSNPVNKALFLGVFFFSVLPWYLAGVQPWDWR